MEFLIISNILLWLLVIMMACVIYALVRQIGILYERVAPAGALAVNRELKAGMDAPALSLTTLRGEQITVGGNSGHQHSQLLFFLSPDCPVCKTLLPALRSAARAEAGWLEIALASDGEEQDHEQFVKDHRLDDFNYVVSELLGKTYGISKLPYAVLIDETGRIASLGIINSREHLDSLFEAKERKVESIQTYIQRQKSEYQQHSEVG